MLATKGHVKFVRGDQAAELGLTRDRSKFGYLCVRDMQLRTDAEVMDEETGEVFPAFARVLPTHFKCPQTGALLPVENPAVWVYQEEAGHEFRPPEYTSFQNTDGPCSGQISARVLDARALRSGNFAVGINGLRQNADHGSHVRSIALRVLEISA